MLQFITALVSTVSLVQLSKGENWFFNCTSTLAFPLYDCANQTFEISEDTIPDGMDKVKIDCRKATGSGCEGVKFIINDVPVNCTINCFNYQSTCKNVEMVLVDVDINDFDSNRYLRCGKSGDYSCEGMDLTLFGSHLLVDCPYPDNCRNMVATLYEGSSITFMAQENTLQNNPVPKIYLDDDSQCFLGPSTGVGWNDLEIYTMTAKPSTTEIQSSSSSEMPTATTTTNAPIPFLLPSTTGMPATVLPTTTGRLFLTSTRPTTTTTKMPTATLLPTIIPTAKQTIANATIISLMTNTTNAVIEESEDSSGRRLVFSARMWLFFCGVLCLSTVGCTFIWTKYKRNQRIVAEAMRLKLAIRLETERKHRREEIVRKASSGRLSKALAKSAENSTDKVVEISVAGKSEANAEHCLSEAGANSSVAGSRMLAVDVTYQGETYLMDSVLSAPSSPSFCFDEVEGAVAGDSAATDALIVGDSEEDEAKVPEDLFDGGWKGGGKVEMIEYPKPEGPQRVRRKCKALPLPGSGDGHYVDGTVLPTLLLAMNTFSEGPSSGFAALRQADIEHSPVGDATADGSSQSGTFWRESPSIAMPPSLPSIATAKLAEVSKKKKEPKRILKGTRKRKLAKTEVDFNLLEASAEQRAKWTHSQWDQYYRAYDYECRYPEAYRQSMDGRSMRQ